MGDENISLGHNSITIAVVKNAEQLAHALAIRAICMFEEAGLDVDQAFDGNDYQATHIIVYSGKEPIGAARVRWFKDFAEIERTCFRKAYRDPRTPTPSCSLCVQSRCGEGLLYRHYTC